MFPKFFKYKKGVPPITGGIFPCIIASIASWHYYTLGKPLVITSTYNGVHSENSLHYYGLAIDVRTKDKTSSEVKQFLDYLKIYNDIGFDIVNENDHIHIEYDCT